MDAEQQGVSSRATFTATHWSVVLSAKDHASTKSAAALETLCGRYWYPLYTFIRRKGYGPHDAQDLTQSFFARLLEKDYLKSVDPTKGKFRSFLLGSLEHFLVNEWRRTQTQKRGGKAAFVSLDEHQAEQKYLQMPASELSPEKLFEQQWATTLLEQVLAQLRDEFIASGKWHTFEELKVFLTGEKKAVSYGDLAKKLSTTEGALKMTVSRMRQRYGELLRLEIANTVSSPAEVEEELRALLAALSG
jgi:RNA polymerase sigma-70 factor (ECF subfamily)